MGFGGGFKSGIGVDGLLLGYTRNTGSADGTGKEIVLSVPQGQIGDLGAGRSAAHPGGDTNFGSPGDSAFQVIITDGVEMGDGSNYLGLTFTMPASGRTLVHAGPGIWRCHSADTFTQIPGDDDAIYGWIPTDTQLQLSHTRSGISGVAPSSMGNINKGAIFASLSTTSGSYTCAGPKNEFQVCIARSWKGATIGGLIVQPGVFEPLRFPEWEMTGAAGSSHTVYLALGSTSDHGSGTTIFAWGGSGSAAPSPAHDDSPSYGPIWLKAVSLPSA